MIDNTDDHKKNHSLLIVNPSANGRLQLAPAYDVVPTNSGQGHQEFICGNQGRDSTIENAMSQCDAFGLTPAQGVAEVAAVIEAVNGWNEHFERCGVLSRDIASLEERIDGGSLRTARAAFEPGHVASAPVRRRKRSPFQLS